MALDSTTVWVVVAGVAVVTYLLRASFLLGIDRLGELPPALERVLPFVPTAVLAALVAPNLFVPEGAIAIGPGNGRLVAGTVAFVVASRTGNMLATVGVGMGVLWGLQWLA